MQFQTKIRPELRPNLGITFRPLGRYKLRPVILLLIYIYFIILIKLLFMGSHC